MKRRKGIFRSAVSMLLAAMLYISMLPVGAYAAGTVSGADMAAVLDGEADADDAGLDGDIILGGAAPEDTSGLDGNDSHFIMSVQGIQSELGQSEPGQSGPMQPESTQSAPMRLAPRRAAMPGTGVSDLAWTVAAGAFVPKNGVLGTTFDPNAPLQVGTPGGSVKVAKGVAATGNKNEFEITLDVTTRDVITDGPTTNDAAIALVFDQSASMDLCLQCGYAAKIHTTSTSAVLGHRFTNSTGGTKCVYITKYVNGTPMRCNKTRKAHGITDHSAVTLLKPAKDNACAFLDRLVALAEPESHLYLSFIRFSSEAYKMTFTDSSGKSVQWIDIMDPVNLATVKSGINNITKGQNLTNMDQSFKYAGQLLEDAAVSSISRQNKFTVLLSDGAPTGLTSSGSGTSASICKSVISAANTLKQKCCGLYSIFLDDGSGKKSCYDYNGTAVTPHDFLELFSTGVYMADASNAANALSNSFTSISKTITNTVQSWIMEDPMGVGVQFGGVTSGQDSRSVKFSAGKLTWHLKADVPISTADGNAYQLKYLVTVDPPTDSHAEGDVIPFSGYSYLAYAILNDKGQMVDEVGTVKADQTTRDTIAFNVPGVMASVRDNTETSEFELPKTGGIGTGPVYVAGIVAMLAGLGLPAGRRRRRK